MMSAFAQIRSAALVLSLSAIALAQSVPATPLKVRSVAPQPASGASTPTLPALRAGMPAPQFKVANWFKGTPVERFEAGKIYVVEFWATWCGPCKQSIPHITELARKYTDKVTVIGVSVWERPTEETNQGIAAIVGPFVKEMGNKMAYNVAVDDPNGTAANAWLVPARANGIPTAFIIGKDGKIAWIGHPMEMDKPLEAVVGGTFDIQAEAARQLKSLQERSELDRLVVPIRAALTAKDPNAVLKAVDEALAAKPEMEDNLMPVKLNALLQTKEASAFAYLKTLADKGYFQKNPRMTYTMMTVINQYTDTMKKPDWPLVVGILAAASEVQENRDWLLLPSYAEALARAGQIDKAIEIQQKAIEIASPLVGTNVQQTWIDAQKKRLDEYKARKN